MYSAALGTAKFSIRTRHLGFIAVSRRLLESTCARRNVAQAFLPVRFSEPNLAQTKLPLSREQLNQTQLTH